MVNVLTGSSLFSGVIKRIAGTSPERALPRLAPRSFRAQFAAHGRGDPVLLFPDTFTNYFRPRTGIAAARVLEASGARVELPAESLCCGRPYYDYGMLDRAKANLEGILAALEALPSSKSAAGKQEQAA